MLFKEYDQNDKSLVESIKIAGLGEHKAQKLIRLANKKNKHTKSLFVNGCKYHQS